MEGSSDTDAQLETIWFCEVLVLKLEHETVEARFVRSGVLAA